MKELATMAFLTFSGAIGIGLLGFIGVWREKHRRKASPLHLVFVALLIATETGGLLLSLSPVSDSSNSIVFLGEAISLLVAGVILTSSLVIEQYRQSTWTLAGACALLGIAAFLMLAIASTSTGTPPPINPGSLIG